MLCIFVYRDCTGGLSGAVALVTTGDVGQYMESRNHLLVREQFSQILRYYSPDYEAQPHQTNDVVCSLLFHVPFIQFHITDQLLLRVELCQKRSSSPHCSADHIIILASSHVQADCMTLQNIIISFCFVGNRSLLIRFPLATIFQRIWYRYAWYTWFCTSESTTTFKDSVLGPSMWDHIC